MTAPLAGIAANLSDVDALVLSSYGEGGKTVDAIVAETDLRPAAVASIIARLAENDRKRARDILEAWEGLNQAPAEPEHAAARPAPGLEEAGDAIADLIARAVATGVPKLVRAADKIGDLVDQLDKELSAHDRTAALRAEQEALAARLAEIDKQLGVKRAAAVVDDSKAIRLWAAERSVECPARGRIPAAVRARYQLWSATSTPTADAR